MQESDALVISRVRAGDDDAFRELVERHGRAVFRVAFRVTGRVEDAEDVVQETFLRAYRQLSRFEARSNIRRTLLITAGGKALLAERPDAERDAYLRRHSTEEDDLVNAFLEEYDTIKRTRIATNAHRGRFAIATTVHDRSGDAVASITLVGPMAKAQPRAKKLSEILLRHVDSWAQRTMTPREAI